MLAAAGTLAGEWGKYFVVPLSAAILVLATFGLGVRLVSPAAGVIGAALVATSPIVLLSAFVMLSDLPTAAAWAVAIYFLTGTTSRSSLLAGLAAGVAVLTRPNHLPLVAVASLAYVDRMRNPSQRREAFQHITLFCLGSSVGIAGVAAINTALFGSPFVSGYGPLAGYFSPSHIVPNLRRYPAWIAELHTPLALLGLVALALPTRRLWPAATRPAFVLVLAAFATSLFSLYLIYLVFETWEYLRFLLALWPPMMVGVSALLVVLLRSRVAVLRWIAMALALAVPSMQMRKAIEKGVFANWEFERRYISGALMTANHTVPNSVVLSMQHSGAVRYYAGRMTIRYDSMSGDQIDNAVGWLTTRKVHVYLLAEDWEIPMIEKIWAGARTWESIQSSPLAVSTHMGRLSLFDISTPRSSDDATDYVEEVQRGIAVPGPVELPALVFHEP